MTGWSDLGRPGRVRVGVWGLGVEGRATLRRLHFEAVEPWIVVPDQAALDAGGLQDLLDCQVVIKSPGISPYDPPARTLVEAGVELVGGLGLWLAEAPRDHIACVTGTKGKSTTASIASALAHGLHVRSLAGGNLGIPPWDPADSDADSVDWFFIETSSYQAHDITVGPRVVVVTSLDQDHLTWHHGYEQYVADKLSLCTRPGVEVVIAPSGDAELARYAHLLGPNVVWVDDDHPSWIDGLRLIGEHNVRNALLAQRAMVELGIPRADDPEALAGATWVYQPLRSRLTPVGTVGGVDFVDDSLSTNVLPTVAGVASFPGRRVALLVGGQDRGIDYHPLGTALAERTDPLLVLTLPDSGPRIAAELRAAAPGLAVQECDDLESATRAAYDWARPDGVVLLSPAAPSFGRFRDYTERADAFEAAMRGLG